MRGSPRILSLLMSVDEIGDLWLAFLAVAVDAAVALLEHHQRPRDIEVDHPVGQEVQVDAFGRDVGGDEQAQRRLVAAEVLDGLLDSMSESPEASPCRIATCSVFRSQRLRQVLFEKA